MLDDLKFIHQRDGQDALGVAEKQWQQLQHTYDVKVEPTQPIVNVVWGGMGGSGWPALYIKSLGQLKVPFEVVNDYNLPTYVGPNTLFIASSYSGNTEETLAALTEAEKRGAQIVVTTAGGKLMERAKQSNHPLFAIPSGIQPRMSSFFFLSAIAHLFEQLSLCKDGLVKEFADTGKWLEGQKDTWRPDVAKKDNQAKQIATELAGKTVIAYSGPLRTQKRFVVTEKLLSGKRPSPIVIEPKGETHVQQLLWASMLCDFVTIYLALLNNVNPTPVDLVEKFKAELNK
jgi:glucose/mannose-6-phosphate isomerase